MLSAVLKLFLFSFLNDVDQDVDLVVSVGGDGTALSASHYLSASIPLLGVNSDPGDELDNLASEHIPLLATLCVCTYRWCTKQQHSRNNNSVFIVSDGKQGR